MDAATPFENYFSEEDRAWLKGLAAYWYDSETYQPFTDDDKLANLCANIAERILEDNPRSAEWVLENNDQALVRYQDEPTFAKLVVMALRYGVACEDGPCANFLGALHVRGMMVDQDYRRAVELYMLGERKGVAQSVVNLGYAYEYGWLAEPDYTRAFMQYAKVAALGEHSEALYKMGDMYCRAQAVERDLRVAYLYYEKSFKKAGNNLELKAQGAFRMAQLIEDPDNRTWDIPYDPLRALELYQLAERGLRLAVAHGFTYYTQRLQDALAGQARIRDLLDSGAFEL